MQRARAILGFVIGCWVFSSVALADKAQKTVPDDIEVHPQEKTAFIVTSDQPQFQIKLKSNPTTGYSWFLRDWNSEVMEPVKHVFQAAADQKLVGAPGYELWTFRAKPAAFVVPEQTMIRFVYARPWEAAENGAQVVFRVTTVHK